MSSSDEEDITLVCLICGIEDKTENFKNWLLVGNHGDVICPECNPELKDEIIRKQRKEIRKLKAHSNLTKGKQVDLVKTDTE